MFHQQGDAGLRLVVQHDVDGVQSWVLKLQLLNVDDKIASAEMHILREGDIDGDGWEIGHNGTAIGIDEVEAKVMLALITAEKGDTQSNGTLRMNRGELLGVYRIECAQQI